MARTVSAAFKQTPAVSASEQFLEQRLTSALQHLLRAYDYAQDVGRDRWEFAVELSELRRLGLSLADCRWLMCKNWVELARELGPRGDGVRQFRRHLGLSLGKHTCVVLSVNGVAVARSLVHRQAEVPARGFAVDPNKKLRRPLPNWDGQRRELCVGKILVKRYRLPSPNQQAILMALEEEGWPSRIDDPLPVVADLDAKQRLHDTIKNLNRHQHRRCLRFFGDGTGQGVCWEWIRSDAKQRKPR